MSQKKSKKNEQPSVEEEDVYQVESIRDKRIKKGKIQYKIKWLGYNDSECTWENESNVIDKEMIEAFETNRQSKKKNKQTLEVKKDLKEGQKSKKPKTSTSEEVKPAPKTEEKPEKTSATKTNNKKSKKSSDESEDRVTTIKDLTEFAKSIDYVECVFKNENEELMGLVRYKNKKQGTVLVTQLKSLAPIHLIDYYETKLVFNESKDDNKI